MRIGRARPRRRPVLAAAGEADGPLRTGLLAGQRVDAPAVASELRAGAGAGSGAGAGASAGAVVRGFPRTGSVPEQG
ncbi:hypothetical protein [Streptomyces sp. CA-253872]|uniref:hypothetical protein n=1 Tax=Streptomyces sp. CA-253872 TaxID=3240067 RepID=UPI003D8E9939